MENEKYVHLLGVSPGELQSLVKEAVRSSLAEVRGRGIDRAPKTLLRRSEVAEMTGLSIRQIDHKRASGVLPYHKNGRRVLFRWEDVEKFLMDGYVRGTHGK